MGDILEKDSTAGGTTTVIEREEAVKRLHEPGDEERFSHYAKKRDLDESLIMGTPVVALCGKVWVPNRDPQRFPVCPDCKKIFEGLAPGDNGDSGNDD
ncbi:MAG: DUF3039 domain-containing protein [Micrococcaceae bacterium]